jgi:ASCH domain
MKTLSIKQPWAWAIVAGEKNIENRTWRTSYRGPILIHAGARADDDARAEIEARHGLVIPDELPTGGIVGTAVLEDIVEGHDSPWAIDGHYHWILRDAQPLPFAPVRGKLSLFEVDHDHLMRAALVTA